MTWREVFLNDAISNYVIFLLGLLVGVLPSVVGRFRKNATRIEVVKRAETSLLSLGTEAATRLKITFRGLEIDSFYVTEFRIRNRSRRVVEDVELRFRVVRGSPESEIYELHVHDHLDGMRKPMVVAREEHDASGAWVFVNIPYLNSHHDESDEILLRVFASEPINVQQVVGGGKGWHAIFFDQVASDKTLERDLKKPSTLLDKLLVLAVYVFRRARR